MLYYKVKKDYGGKTLWRNGKYHGNLVAHELYTENELNKRNILLCNHVQFNWFDLVEIPKSKTYWFFGARFSNTSGKLISDGNEVKMENTNKK